MKIKYNGNQVAKLIEEEIQSYSSNKHLGIILVGDRKDSELYVSLKIKKCKEMNISTSLMRISQDTTEEEIIKHIQSFNQNAEINGILVQLPLPKHLRKKEQFILDFIDPQKDVDCLTSHNLGLFFAGQSKYYPCTPRAIMAILDYYKILVEGKTVCVVGSGNVGRGISFLLLQRNATVLVTNSHTGNEKVKQLCQQSDIIISCCGQPLMIKNNWVQENCHIIDVGITRIDDKSRKSGYRTVGDVDFDNVIQKANVNKLTVGPVTIMMLLKQLCLSEKN
jgi:methylenetetrahydrofolate dehydrogenase (NADP+)/methenyltetrahydrofolate cyclohydrolase